MTEDVNRYALKEKKWRRRRSRRFSSSYQHQWYSVENEI